MTVPSRRVLLALALLAALGSAEPDWYFQHPDSFPRLPTNRLFYLEQKSGRCPASHRADVPESLNLHLVGKWGAGPSWAVTGRDTVMYLSRGSEVVAINVADPARPRPLSHIQADRLTARAVLRDTLLYVATSGGIEVYDVANPAHARRIIRRPTPVADLQVSDTLVYTISADSFRVFSFADPQNPRQVGACRDSGFVLSVTGGVACVGDRWGLYVIDARNPASPGRIASWGTDVIGVTARNTICCVTTGNPNQPGELNFTILDITNPNLPVPIGSLPGVGGYDCCLADSLAFLSGYYYGGHEFRVLSIADSTQPRVVGTCVTEGSNLGVWALPSQSVAYVADWWWGLAALDIGSLSQPTIDTTLLAASEAKDVAVAGQYAYVADYANGLLVLDISDPAAPVELARLDTAGSRPLIEAVAVRDTVVYVDWYPDPFFRTVSIGNPRSPRFIGHCAAHEGEPNVVVPLDTLVYTAGRLRFQVVNVADPRNPVRVGRLELASEGASGLAIQDTVAYVSYYPLSIIGIADPTQPRLLGSIARGAWGVDVRDSVLVLASGGLVWYNVAEPSNPRAIDSISFAANTFAVRFSDTLVYASSRDELRAVSLANLHEPRMVGQCELPYDGLRLALDSPYAVVACGMAGLAVVEFRHTGISEERRGGEVGRAVRVWPSVTRGRVSVGGRAGPWRLMDVTGKVVAEGSSTGADVDVSRLAPGVYFVSPASSVKRDASGVTKVVITR